MWSRVLMLAAVQILVACAPRRPPLIPLPPEVTLYLAVSDQVAKRDTGNVAAMIETIEADLREAGYTVVVVAAHPADPPPLPRVELQVRTSTPADQEAMGSAQLVSWAIAPIGAAVAIGASGDIAVDTFVVPRTGRPTYMGRTEASSLMAMTEDAQTAAGERAGREIADQLLRTE